jgi:large subunit ribosomal protein L13
VEQSIKGMLPKSKMGRQMATKLKVYKGAHHPHQAQQPVALEFHASNAPKPHLKQEHHRDALEG